MKVALAFKPHSGWAALLVMGRDGNEYVVQSRRRVELVEEEWAKQPYHAAEELEPKEAVSIVKRGIKSAHQIALRELRAALKRERDQGNQVSGCAVVVGNPMPEWTIAEILSVHFRMHQAEGVLFRDALVTAARKCAVPVVAINEKTIKSDGAAVLKTSVDKLLKKIMLMGKTAGPPWSKDQKEAAIAAMIALEN